MSVYISGVLDVCRLTSVHASSKGGGMEGGMLQSHQVILPAQTPSREGGGEGRSGG